MGLLVSGSTANAASLARGLALGVAYPLYRSQHGAAYPLLIKDGVSRLCSAA